MAQVKSYFRDIFNGITSSIGGMALTLRHLFQATKRTNAVGIDNKEYFSQATGIVTLEYPFQSLPVPDNGRYRLHNEIDDCIVCDKCAKICPVDCIDITTIKSTEEIGLTSDGSSKRLYASTFDIDMAKCCFCGLCTTVCPTECLTMTSTFDFSEFDVRNMVYHFTDLSPEQAKEKQQIYDQKQAEKLAGQALKISSTVDVLPSTESVAGVAKPAFKPKFPGTKPIETKEEEKVEGIVPTAEKLVFKPKMPSVKIETDAVNEIRATENKPVPTLSKPVFRPKMPVVKTSDDAAGNSHESTSAAEIPNSEEESKPIISKPVFKPKMKPIIPPPKGDETV